MPKKPGSNAKDVPEKPGKSVNKVQDFVDSLDKVTDLVTFVGKLEEAVNPLGGVGLQLVSWGDGTGVPTSGNLLVVVGIDNKNLLHIRVFDSSGNRVTDADETGLPPEQAQAILNLKQQLPGLLPPHVLADAEKTQVLAEATSIVGQVELGILGPIYAHPERAPIIRQTWDSLFNAWLRLRPRFGAMSDFVFWNFWAVGNATIDPNVIAAPLSQTRGLLCDMQKR